MGARLRSALVGACLAAVVLSVPAHASFPGQNGKIAIERSSDLGAVAQIYTVNPDGSGETPLVAGSSPAWSPDGTKLAFTRVDGLYVSNADGSGVTPIVLETRLTDPTWSPDGSQLAYVRTSSPCDYPFCGHLFRVDTDGTDKTDINQAFLHADDPSWSPDGTKIVVSEDCSGSCNGELSTVKPDGTGASQVIRLARESRAPNWSPDGAKILFDVYDFKSPDPSAGLAVIPSDGSSGFHVLNSSIVRRGSNGPASWSPDGTRIALVDGNSRPFYGDLHVMNSDGSGDVVVTNHGDLRDADWQPILKGYARPKGASPLHTSLVLAYPACSAPSKTHAPPLSFGSCAPTAPLSTQLTVGTPDANSRSAKSIGFLDAKVLGGNPATPADEADVALEASISDVRQKSDLSDYTGQLEARIPLQITDKQNTPYPGGQGPGTVQATTLSFAIPCAATSDTTVGSDCAVMSTTDTLLPGTAVEGKRAIWQAGQVVVYDGGPDNLASTQGDNTLFEVQGVFLP